jgi:hypothetical protein
VPTTFRLFFSSSLIGIHFNKRSQRCLCCHSFVIFFVYGSVVCLFVTFFRFTYVFVCLGYVDKFYLLLVLIIFYLLICLLCSIVFVYLLFSLVHFIYFLPFSVIYSFTTILSYGHLHVVSITNVCCFSNYFGLGVSLYQIFITSYFSHSVSFQRFFIYF